MGHVRTKTVKKSAKVIIEKYYTKLTLDFHTNKRVCEDVAVIPSKRLRNQIAGYASHLSSRSHRRGRRHHRRYVEGARVPRSSQHAEGRGQQILRSQSGVINGVIDQILRLVAFLF